MVSLLSALENNTTLVDLNVGNDEFANANKFG
jgi:hypothetical protein